VKYLKDGIKEGEPFLRMHEFGPFDVRKVGHAKKAGETILAFTLQMSKLHREGSGHESSTSNDPQTLVGPLSGPTVSEISRPAATAQSSLHREHFDQESSTSSDPQTLVEPLLGLTVSEIPRPPATVLSLRRSSRMPARIPPPPSIGGAGKRKG
jgi:hypothetical protein